MAGTLAAAAMLAACGGESTAPLPATASAPQSMASPFVPSAAARSLVGISNGTYEFRVDPRKNQVLMLGANSLVIPANAICNLESSSYGIGHWNEHCTPEKKPLTITAVVKNANSSHPSIDFSPAMRFSPDENVSLYMYVPAAERDKKHDFVLSYCNDARVCVDEARLDPSLKTKTDRSGGVVFRRIKHFSGYVVVVGFLEDLGSLF